MPCTLTTPNPTPHPCLVVPYLMAPPLHAFLASIPSSYSLLTCSSIWYRLVGYRAPSLSSGDQSLSIAQIALSRHPLLSSSFVSLARQNFSSIAPFPLSSLFFRHPSHFLLIVAHFFAYRAQRRALCARYSLRSRERKEGRGERMGEIKNFFLFASLTIRSTTRNALY